MKQIKALQTVVDALKEGVAELGGCQHVDQLLPEEVMLNRRSEELGVNGWNRVRFSFPF